MPVPFNFATSLLMGALLPPLLWRSMALRQAFGNWMLLFLGTFFALIYTPVCTFTLRFFPHWSLLYGFDPQLFPQFEQQLGALSGVLVLMYFAVAVVGYGLSRRAVVKRRPVWAVLPLLLSIAMWVGGLWIWRDRIVAVSDFDGFWQGNAAALHRHMLGTTCILLHTSCMAFLLWLRCRFAHRDPSFF